MPLTVSEIADAVQSGLQRALAQHDLEQAVYSLDALDEVALHPAIAKALAEAGFGVFREQRYPADRVRRKISHGERCDFVLTSNNLPLKHPDAADTLFDPANAVSLCDAFWLEAKVVPQFTIDGPNRYYSSQLLSTVGHDVTKLSKDKGILHAGLLIVLFVSEERIAQHDLTIWQERCLQRGLPIGTPAQRLFPMTDRHGNRVCVISTYPVNHF